MILFWTSDLEIFGPFKDFKRYLLTMGQDNLHNYLLFSILAFINAIQGVYNGLVPVRIVGSACLHCHQLVAVFIALSSIFQMDNV